MCCRGQMPTSLGLSTRDANGVLLLSDKEYSALYTIPKILHYKRCKMREMTLSVESIDCKMGLLPLYLILPFNFL